MPELRSPSRRGLPGPVPLFPPGTPGEGNPPPPILLLLPCLPKPLCCLPVSARPDLQHPPEGKAPAATPGGHGHCHPPEGTWGGPCQPPVPVSHGVLLGEALRARSLAAFSGVSVPRIWGMRGEVREGTGLPKRGYQKVLRVPPRRGGGRVGAPFSAPSFCQQQQAAPFSPCSRGAGG